MGLSYIELNNGLSVQAGDLSRAASRAGFVVQAAGVSASRIAADIEMATDGMGFRWGLMHAVRR